MSEGNRMSGEYRYLTDEELEALIAGVEDHGMLAPPAYLKELIMEEAAGDVNIVRKNRIDRKRARKLLMVYRAKVIGAAAAAIFCLMMVPMEMDGGRLEDGTRHREKVIEEDMVRYQEESERMQSELELREGGFGSFMESMIGKEKAGMAASVWNGMTGLFGREERDYE